MREKKKGTDPDLVSGIYLSVKHLRPRIIWHRNAKTTPTMNDISAR